MVTASCSLCWLTRYLICASSRCFRSVAAFFAAAEALPQAAAESDGEAERGIGKLCLQIGQRSKALRAGLFDGIGAALGIGFDKNARFAVVGHNGALRSVHRGSFRGAVGEMDCGF